VSLAISVPLALLAAVLQVAVVSQVRLLGVSPNLVVLVIVSVVLLRGLGDGVLSALVAGLVLDMASGAPFGLSIACLVAAALVASLGQANVFNAARYLPPVMVLLSVTIYNLLFLFLLWMGGQRLLGWPVLWRVVAPEVLIDILLMPLVYGTLRALHRRLGPPTTELP
jgi:rod shape-determining protein MreD